MFEDIEKIKFFVSWFLIYEITTVQQTYEMAVEVKIWWNISKFIWFFNTIANIYFVFTIPVSVLSGLYTFIILFFLKYHDTETIISTLLLRNLRLEI